MENGKILFSAVQPSGILTIGNYLGALKNFKKLQEDYNCLFSIADLHTLTVKQEPANLRKNTYELIAFYLACGLDPEKSILFVQSHVHEHAELTWILNSITYPGELQRMTQFKDKSLKHADNVNMALMDYPVLMAADILLYGTELVPVGADQKQHLELTRDLAIRFNGRFGDTFKIPEPYINKVGARVMSLQSPDQKMSKSDENANGFISLNDTKDVIMAKFKRAVTDSDNRIIADESKPGITNLLTIYSLFTDRSIKEAEAEFEGKGYGEFKLKVGEAVADVVDKIRNEKDRYLQDKDYLNKVLANGAERAHRIAYKTMSKVYRKSGLLQL